MPAYRLSVYPDASPIADQLVPVGYCTDISYGGGGSYYTSSYCTVPEIQHITSMLYVLNNGTWFLQDVAADGCGGCNYAYAWGGGSMTSGLQYIVFSSADISYAVIDPLISGYSWIES